MNPSEVYWLVLGIAVGFLLSGLVSAFPQKGDPPVPVKLFSSATVFFVIAYVAFLGMRR